MDEVRTVLNQGEFFIVLAFGITYAFTFIWWETWTGRAALTLAIAVVSGQLQNVLTYWHIISIHAPAWLTWVTAIAPGVTGLAIGVLMADGVINLRASPETATTRAANYLLRLGSNHVDQHPGELPARVRSLWGDSIGQCVRMSERKTPVTDTAHATESTQALIYPAGMKWMDVETSDGTFELYGRLIDVVDNERRDRPRWAEIELLEFLDTNEEHNETNPKPEWRTYGQVIYMIHTMGHSVVYHHFDSACNKGVAVSVEDFPLRAEFPVEELQPCEKCDPPELDFTRTAGGEVIWQGLTPPGTRFDLEVLRHTPAFYPTAEDLLDGLRRHIKIPCPVCTGTGKLAGMQCNECDGKGFTNGPKTLTSPGARLVEKAKFKDPRIRKAAERKRRL